MVSDNEDGYEYEYSAEDTETFYVDLDLSSVNNVLKSENAGDRKSLKAPHKSHTAVPRKAGGKGKSKGQDSGDDDDHGDDDDENNEDNETRANQVNQGDGTPQRGGQQTSAAHEDPHTMDLDGSGDGIQILDLHSHNPIISYRNQVYSCRWTDMIGTTMFFTKHNETPLHEPEIATEDYDLMGTSRLKLVGYRANVIAKSKPRPEQDTVDESDTQAAGRPEVFQEAEDGPSHGQENSNRRTAQPTQSKRYDASSSAPASASTRADPQIQSQAKRQATFLEKLRDIKRARGEKDVVRTFVDRPTLEAAQKEREEMAKMRKEIEKLNAKVVKGDTKALERLQEIYSRIDEADSDEDGNSDQGGQKNNNSINHGTNLGTSNEQV